jgi:hypothetical protein
MLRLFLYDFSQLHSDFPTQDQTHYPNDKQSTCLWFHLTAPFLGHEKGLPRLGALHLRLIDLLVEALNQVG